MVPSFWSSRCAIKLKGNQHTGSVRHQPKDISMCLRYEAEFPKTSPRLLTFKASTPCRTSFKFTSHLIGLPCIEPMILVDRPGTATPANWPILRLVDLENKHGSLMHLLSYLQTTITYMLCYYDNLMLVMSCSTRLERSETRSVTELLSDCNSIPLF